jgi:hypothetical protein
LVVHGRTAMRRAKNHGYAQKVCIGGTPASTKLGRVNIPTQAKIRLEWATRRIANSEVKRFGMEMAQCFPEQENVGACADISANGDA